MKPIQGHKRLLLIVVEIGKFMKYIIRMCEFFNHELIK